MAFDHEVERSDLVKIAQGKVAGYSLVHKFGYSNSIGASIVPLAFGTVYQTPTSAVALEAISTNAADTADGAGAREITIQYLNSSFVEGTAVMTMAGASASSTVPDVLRFFRGWVSKGGSYVTQSTPSQFGAISFRVAGGGAEWALIPELQSSFGAGQTLIAAYTVPAGKTAYILSEEYTVDSNKAISFYFFKRENADDTSAPFTGTMRINNLNIGLKEPFMRAHRTPEMFPEKTDMGIMATAATASDASGEFELLLIDNNYL